MNWSVSQERLTSSDLAGYKKVDTSIQKALFGIRARNGMASAADVSVASI